jgi:signal transduction histidine kinase
VSTERITPDPDRLAALAEFAAGAGHEINNPLATIVGRVQQLLRGETDPVRRAALHSIGAQAYRIRDMIGDVMLLARPPAPERRRCSAAELAKNVLEKFHANPNSAGCRVLLESAPEAEIFADPAQFAIVLHELLRNSREALSPKGGEIRLAICVAESEGRPCCKIEVTDSGRGFSEVEARHAFDPFFSGRQAGRGLGFGLCKCFRIAELHGATLQIASNPAGPTITRVIWPSSADSAESADE